MFFYFYDMRQLLIVLVISVLVFLDGSISGNELQHD